MSAVLPPAFAYPAILVLFYPGRRRGLEVAVSYIAFVLWSSVTLELSGPRARPSPRGSGKSTHGLLGLAGTKAYFWYETPRGIKSHGLIIWCWGGPTFLPRGRAQLGPTDTLPVILRLSRHRYASMQICYVSIPIYYSTLLKSWFSLPSHPACSLTLIRGTCVVIFFAEPTGEKHRTRL